MLIQNVSSSECCCALNLILQGLLLQKFRTTTPCSLSLMTRSSMPYVKPTPSVSLVSVHPSRFPAEISFFILFQRFVFCGDSFLGVNSKVPITPPVRSMRAQDREPSC